MVGRGNNKKSLAYVDNVAAFLDFATRLGTGVHLFNYVDKPDLDTNSLVQLVKKKMGQSAKIRFRLPYYVGYGIGCIFDCMAFITRRRFPISAVRVRKFCENSQFSAARLQATGFKPLVTLEEGLNRMIQSEFGLGCEVDRTQAATTSLAENGQRSKTEEARTDVLTPHEHTSAFVESKS